MVDIINDVFAKLGIEKGFFVEFGAWDGFYLCNTIHLRQKGWGGVYIESDEKKFIKLKDNFFNNKDIHCIHKKVEVAGENKLENILFSTLGLYPVIEILSIDIDGYDLSIWRSLINVRPKLVCIEYNSTIPFDIEYEQTVNSYIGSSAKAIMNYAKEIGYDLINLDDTNLLFIDCKFNLNENIAKILKLEDVWQGPRFAFSMEGEMLYFYNKKLVNWEFIEHPWGAGFLYQPYPKWIRGTLKKRYLQLVYNLTFTLLFRTTYFTKLVGFIFKKLAEINKSSKKNRNK